MSEALSSCGTNSPCAQEEPPAQRGTIPLSKFTETRSRALTGIQHPRLEEIPLKSTPAGGPGSPQPGEKSYSCRSSCNFLAGLVQPPGLSRACDWPVRREGGLPGPPPLPYLSRVSPSCWPRLRGPAWEVFVPNLGSPLPPWRPGPPPGRSASPSCCCSQTSIAPHLSPPRCG